MPPKNKLGAIVPFEFLPEGRPLAVAEPHPKTSSFVNVSGRPGSGKTTLILNLLCRPRHLGQKFERVFIVSPSLTSIGHKDLFAGIPQNQIYDDLTEDTIDAITDTVHNECQGERCLLVVDDCVNQLHEHKIMKKLARFIFNRRHMCSINGEPGFMSVLLSTQVLNRVPLLIRKQASQCYIFPTRAAREIDSIRTEMVPTTQQNLKSILKTAWRDEHSPLLVDADRHRFYGIGPDGEFFRIASQDDMDFNQLVHGGAAGECEPASEDIDPVERARRATVDNYYKHG